MDWEWYVRHQDEVERAICGVTRRLKLQSADAADFGQDARCFVAAAGSRIFSRFLGRSSLYTYLSVTLWRFGLDWVTAEARNRRRLAKALSAASIQRGLWGRSEDEAIDSDLADPLRAWIAALSASDRELLRLRFMETRPMSEIAVRLLTTRSAAFKRLYRVLKAGRRHLETAGIDRGELNHLERWFRDSADDLLASSRELLPDTPGETRAT